MYLAGYTVECFLKAMLPASVASKLRRELLLEFRGNRGHDIERLGLLYRRHVRGPIPGDITRHLTRVASWSTDLRYETGLMRSREAEEFMESVIVVSQWAKERM